MDEKEEKTIKRKKFNVVALGEVNVGKSSIISRLIGGNFKKDTLPTIGLDCYETKKKFDGKEYIFKIIDTAGQERFKSITEKIIKKADGFFILFAVDNPNSFQKVKCWINTIAEQTDLTNKPLILVGNKIDLIPREVSNEQGVKFAKEKKIKYYEVSAKTGFFVKEIFDVLFGDIYNLKKEEDVDDHFLLRKITKEKTKKKKKFCSS